MYGRGRAIRRTQRWRVCLVGGAAGISLATATGLGVSAANAPGTTSTHSATPTTTHGTSSGDDSNGSTSTNDQSPLVAGGSGDSHAQSNGS